MEISINKLMKSFGDNQVLKGINIHMNSNEALGILGRNGAGKTTIVRIFMGVFPQDSGEILVDGKPIDRNKLKIGYLPEERGLYQKKTIIEQLIYFGVLKGLTKKQAKESAEYWLDKLKMSEYKNRKLDILSKGNQQKIQLVVALVSNPDVVILDEPFSGLDPVNAILLKDVVKELIALGKIVLLSSHQMNYIEEFCNNIAILNGGKIVLSGSIQEIKRSYDRSKIIISSSDAKKIKDFLGDICTIKNDKLIVQLSSESEKNALMAKLAEQNFDIDEIKVFEPSLNDIFVQYTEDNI